MSDPSLRLRSQHRLTVIGLAVLVLAIARPLWAVPDVWDPRLDQICGLFLQDQAATPAAEHGYWRLTRAEFENEQQSGQNHNIYYKCLDEFGKPIENQKVWASRPYTNENVFESQLTKGAFDGFWGNYPIYADTCPGTTVCGPTRPGPWPYNAYVDTTSSPKGYAGPSDKVYGMGMTSPEGTPCKAHVNFRLTWQWTVPQPKIQLAPTSLTRSVPQGLPPSPPTDSFTIRNSGGGTLSYSISDNVSWLSITPTGGQVVGSEVDTITVSYGTAGLSLGTHIGVITVTGANAGNSPQTITVTVTVRPPVYLGDFDSDGDVDQQDFGHLQGCLSGYGIPATADCLDAKLDADVDADDQDVQLFQACMNGPGHPGSASCAR